MTEGFSRQPLGYVASSYVPGRDHINTRKWQHHPKGLGEERVGSGSDALKPSCCACCLMV